MCCCAVYCASRPTKGGVNEPDLSFPRHILQKYTLAVAIAVLKEKPTDVSINNYIELLRNRINDENGDLDETICSDDFKFDDNTNCSGNSEIPKISTLPINVTQVGINTDTNNKDLNEPVNSEESILSQNLLDGYIINEGVSIHNNNAQNNKKYYIQNKNVRVANNTVNHQQNVINAQESNLIENINQDSVTILRNYVINNNTTEDKYPVTFKDCSTNTTTTSISQSTNIDSKHFSADNLTFNNGSVSLIKDNLITNRINTESMQIIKEDAHLLMSIPTNDNTNDTTQSQYVVLLNDNNSNKHANGIPKHDPHMNATINIPENTQNYTHVSQSQTENVYIKEILLQSKAKNNREQNKNIHEDNDDKETDDNGKNISINEVNNKYNEDVDMGTQIDEPMQCIQDKELAYPMQDTELVYNLNLSTQEPLRALPINPEHERQDPMEEIDEVDGEDSSKSQAELIPFKVLEELNKVKSYLGRRHDRRMSNESSLESGYKSDSQSRSFKSASQLTCNSVNQSAHCLFEYLMNIPLLAASQEITNEISNTLFLLIDRLHEEEKYLGFLDKLLETVDELLQKLLEGDNCQDNLLLRKDEQIQRLLLLNRSRHIQAYTIDKLTGILEKIHNKISKEEQIYEIDNINETENTCYIFHILQLLLQRYTKHKVVTTPVNSQNELKKSSITDIWRRKWDPKYKEQPKSEGSVKTKCVLVKCSEVLNKLVVTCMDGYSLVCYAALQCFNVLQN